MTDYWAGVLVGGFLGVQMTLAFVVALMWKRGFFPARFRDWF